MKRKKHATTLVLIALSIALLVPTGGAAQSESPASAAEMVTDYLQQDIFLRPGVGLKKVKIGTPFEQVRRTWGQPAEAGRHRLLDNEWVYEIAGHTRIVLIGDDSVEIMRIEGGVNSPYTTTEGASFGMPRHQLATIYGGTDAESNKVTYAERGIGFTLERGQVSVIRVFRAK